MRARWRLARRALLRLGTRIAAWWTGEDGGDIHERRGEPLAERHDAPRARPAEPPPPAPGATGAPGTTRSTPTRPGVAARLSEPKATPAPATPTDRFALALQGGGAFGALAAGALMRLLDDDDDDTLPWQRLAAISGTSAGAVNAALLTSGYVRGGRAGARAALAGFWQELGRIGNWQALLDLNPAATPPAQGLWWGPAAATATTAAWARAWAQPLAAQLSPYQTNPLDLNPLRQLLARHVDPLALADAPWRLALAATDVAEGRLHLFGNADFDGARHGIEPILASACLPQLMQATSVGGRAYWDGGFCANPPLATLAEDARIGTVLLLTIAPPPLATELPRSRPAIAAHALHIQFDAVLQAELRLWQAAARRHAARSGIAEATLPRLLRLDLPTLAARPVDAHAALDTRAAVLEDLLSQGAEAAATWLRATPNALTEAPAQPALLSPVGPAP